MTNASVSAGPVAMSPDQTLFNKTIWRVMPLVTACMVIGTIDRSNIGFAKLRMAGDLGMSEAVFAFGSSLFYVGYLLLEVPSALAAHRYGARLWFSRIMFTWGVATLLLALANSVTSFYVLRFLLGAAEAGLYPGLLYYITLWFPKSQHARAMGFLTIGSAIGNSFGALASGPLLDMEGVLGLHGWQWIFVVTGALPVIGAGLLLWVLRDTPRDATFLNAAEKARLSELIEQDAIDLGHPKRPLAALANPAVLFHGVAYALILTALYGVIYWSPSIVKSFGVTGTQNGLLVALPWAIDVVLLLLLPRRLQSRSAILTAMIVLAGLGTLTFGSAFFLQSSLLKYLALMIGIPCISIGIALYWTFPVRLFRGAQSAAAIAAISMVGNFGGLIGQNMMPAVAKAGGGTTAALFVPCVCLMAVLVGSVVALARSRAAEPQPSHDGRLP